MFRIHLASLPVFLLSSLAILNAQSAPPEPTIHAHSNLVIVDVTVTDAKNIPIRDLSPSDFTVLEDGKPQKINSFEVHSASDAVTLAPVPQLPPGVFTNRTAAPANGALNVLLLDKLNTPMKDQGWVLAQLRDYLKTMRPGTRIAIFGLTTQLRLLQGFTSNPEQLKAFLAGKKALPGASVAMNDSMAGDNAGSPTLSDQMADLVGDSPDAAIMLANLQQFEAEQQSFQLQLRARYTLDALNQLARYLELLPGRKNILWFSGSFPINILPDGDLQNPFAVVADASDEFRETTNLLARSQVAVYPIDARGLMNAPMLDASNSGAKYAKNPGAFAKDNAKFFQQTASEHGTMQQMAEATGGIAYVNTNGLKEAAQSAIDSGSNYYTLTYSPANTKWKGEYRKIQVKLDKPGLELSYRRGYYADDPSVPVRYDQPRSASKESKELPPPYDPMRAAMLHGGPEPTQILFEAAVRTVEGPEESAALPENQPNPKIKGPFRRYIVHFTVNPRDLNCEATADRVHHCHIEFVASAFDADGMLVNVQAKVLAAALDDNRYNAFLNGKFAYNLQISVPVKGEHFLRLGMHDLTAEHIGALEIPLAAIAKLPPVNVSAPPATH